MDGKEFRVAAALLVAVIVAIGGIFYVRVSGADSLREAFADPYDSAPWDDDDYEEWEECYELYEEVGLWGFSEGLYSTQDTHAENLADGTYRTASLSIAFFDDEVQAARAQASREAAFGQLKSSDCFEEMEDLTQGESVSPAIASHEGISWATLVDYAFDDTNAGRREVYIWIEGTRTVTLDLWIDDTRGGEEFAREQYERARETASARR